MRAPVCLRPLDATFLPWVAGGLLAAAPAAAEPWPWASLELNPADRPLLEAKAALEAEQPEKAAALLSAADGALPDLRSLWLGEALARLGRHGEAAAELSRVMPRVARCDGGAGPVAIELAAVAQRAELLGRTAPLAAAELELALPPDAERFARAAVRLRAAGQPARAEEVERRLLVELADGPAAQALAARLEPRGVAERLKTPALRLARVRVLLETQQNEQARVEAEQLLGELGASSPLRCELLFITGKASRKLRQYRPAVRALESARAACSGETQPIGLRAALLEVQVRTIRGDARGAGAVIRWMEGRAPGHSFLDDAQLFLANLHDDAGRRDEARKLYLQILEHAAGSDSAAEARWRLAYHELKAQDPAALPRLEALSQEAALPLQERGRAAYWLARALEAQEPERARALYQGTVRGLSFYGWLALDHLRRTRPEWHQALSGDLLALRENTVPVPALPPAWAQAPELDRARRLAALGEVEAAEAELLRLQCAELDDASAVALAAAFDRVGAYPAAQRLLRGRSAQLLRGLEPATLRAYQLAYSRPFQPLLEKAASEARVESLFLYALSREESTFDPAIVSWAGAVGLTQLMPDTALTMYQILERKRLDLARLVEPELNLRLGARVLKDGLRKFRDVEPLALVAYNAGPGAARKMIPTEGQPFERWVEEISIRETRKYVKRVSETWGVYRLLYDRERPFIQLPERIGGP